MNLDNGVLSSYYKVKNMAINSLIQFRKGSSSEWISANPVLASGEPGYDITSNIFKIGDGITPWVDLSQIGASGLSSEFNLDTSLVAGTGISFIYDSGNNSLTIAATGVGGSNITSINDINDFGSGVSGLLPVKNIIAGSYIDVSSISGIFTISSTGLQPSGNYAILNHSHIIVDISGLQTALDSKQPSGNYATSSHNHTVSQITDFNSSVSGLLPITNIIGGTGISVSIDSKTYTVNISVNDTIFHPFLLGGM